MTITEMLKKVQYATDDKGNELVLIDRAAWEELLEILEDLEDEEELRSAKNEEDELIPWEQVKAEYWAAHPDAQDNL